MRPGPESKDIADIPAQDLPGASTGSQKRWKSMINGGSAEQPDKDGTARHNQADAPAKPVAPDADLSGRPEKNE